MPNLVCSADIDAFMASVNKLTARDNLGTKQNLSQVVTSDADLVAAITAVEANASYNSGTIYVTNSFTIVSAMPAMAKDYTFVGIPDANGNRPLLTKGNGAVFTINGRRLILSNLRFTYSGSQDFFNVGAQSCYVTCFGCDFAQTANGGRYFRREYQGGLAAEFYDCTATIAGTAYLMYIGVSNAANTTIPEGEILFVGCDLLGRVLMCENRARVRVVTVNSTVRDNGNGCWYATEYSAGSTNVTVQYNGGVNVSTALAAGSTDPITFTDTSLLPTQTTAVSAAITAAKNVRFTGSTAGQTLTLPSALDGKERWVINKASVSVDVAIAGGGDTINGGAGPYTVPAGTTQRFACIGTDWNT